MSHFAVLVIGENVEKQLAPYHEFECTGYDDQYVQDIDMTVKVLKEYEEDTTHQYKAPDGSLHKPYEDRFYRDPLPEEEAKIGAPAGTGVGKGLRWTSKDWNDGKGYRVKVHFLPNGWEEVTVSTKEIQSFADWVKDNHGRDAIKNYSELDLSKKHKYGYVLLGENDEVLKVIIRTNPNCKWDWYQIGGRWTGFFKLKSGERSGKTGSPKENIDFGAMRDAAGQEAGQRYDKVISLIGESLKDFISWPEMRDELHKDDIDKARKEYHQQEAVKKLRASDEDGLFFYDIYDIDDIDDFLCSRDEYVEKARNGAVSTFAVVKDGEWYEKGKMGWWASVSDEKAEGQWAEEFGKLLDATPGDTLLTVVDCHI